MPVTDYEQDLNELLKDPEFAAGYMNAAVEEDVSDALLLAMSRVAHAQRDMAVFADKQPAD
jgi:DNA-binding phage protein